MSNQRNDYDNLTEFLRLHAPRPQAPNADLEGRIIAATKKFNLRTWLGSFTFHLRNILLALLSCVALVASIGLGIWMGESRRDLLLLEKFVEQSWDGALRADSGMEAEYVLSDLDGN